MAGIFISYRRDDVPGQAGRLFDSLANRFGEDCVFIDVESLAPSEHFDAAIERAIGQCDVVLVLIGSHWIDDRTRLNDPRDFIRLELATALRLERPIIPLLIDEMRMPQPSDLPADLQGLARSQAFDIRHRTFRRDTEELIGFLQARYIRSTGADRRRLELAMTQSGWPFSWFAALSRATGPAGAVLLPAALLAVAVMYPTRRIAFERGSDAKELELTKKYELISSEHRSADLVLKGLVIDGSQVVEDAEVKVTNMQNGQSKTARTSQFGRYEMDLKTIGISEDATMQLDVTKANYLPVHEQFAFRDGIEYRSILRGQR